MKTKRGEWKRVQIGYVGGSLQLTLDDDQYGQVDQGKTYQFEGTVRGSGNYGDPTLDVEKLKQVEMAKVA